MIQNILKHFNLQESSIIAKAWGNYPQLTAFELVAAILANKNLDSAAKTLGRSRVNISKLLNKHFKISRGNRPWRDVFMELQ